MNKLVNYISLSVLSAFSTYSFAAIFYDISNERLRLQSSGPVQKYRLVGADMHSLNALLHSVPSQSSRVVAPSIELPMPDGSMRKFTLQRNNTLSPEFAKGSPEMMTFDGYDVDNPEDLVKLDITPLGFHAMVITPTQGTIYIDPISLKDSKHYKVYFKNDVEPPQGTVCKFAEIKHKVQAQMSFKPGTSAKFASCALRTYRLAMAATAEYTAFFGGQTNAQAAIVTLMNRVDGVYQKDLGVNMVLLNRKDIIYTNPTTDPYSSGDGESMLSQNQTNLNKVVGINNYDIGHVVDISSGGIAGLAVVCGPEKAMGTTGINDPEGDPFAIDFVAHEMGHQFGGDHTFNNSCGGNREDNFAVEPGSGTTIMGYAGVCAPNVQLHSNDYFHGMSLQEMGAFINGSGGTCAKKTNLTMVAPTVTDPPNIVVPKSTPFMLNGNATGANSANFTYTWEQMDHQISTQPPVATAVGGPNFRSFKGTTNKTRYLPSLQALSNMGPFTWEVRPSVGRVMNFRLTVRQNNTGGLNCNNFQDMQVTVSGAAGPFIVTSFDAAGVVWNHNTQKTITWNVAKTNLAPVNATTVDILLSTDKGLSFSTVLASGVANDGSQVITVPSTVTTNTARIMVRSHNHTFFNVTHHDIKIQ